MPIHRVIPINGRDPFFEALSSRKMNKYWVDLPGLKLTGNQIEGLYYASLEEVKVYPGKSMTITYNSLVKKGLVKLQWNNWPALTKKGKKVMLTLKKLKMLPE